MNKYSLGLPEFSGFYAPDDALHIPFEHEPYVHFNKSMRLELHCPVAPYVLDKLLLESVDLAGFSLIKELNALVIDTAVLLTNAHAYNRLFFALGIGAGSPADRFWNIALHRFQILYFFNLSNQDKGDKS